MIKLGTAFLFVILASFSYGKSKKYFNGWSGFCKDSITHYNNLQVQTGSFSDGVCFISLHPMSVSDDLVYRDYLITSENFLMVFNSFGKFRKGPSTGAREYFFIPRKEQMGFRHNENTQELEVQMANADVLHFNENKAELVSSEKGKIELRAEIDPKFRGGVEFVHYKGMLMDAGWAGDHSPSDDKNGITQIRNSKEQLCKISNAKIFDYIGEEHRLKKEDRLLAAAIKKQCPSFLIEF